jgi:putative DNA primase/helicase
MSTDRTQNPPGQQPRKTLRPLKKLPKVDIADAVAITALRLKARQNGYAPIKAHDKRPMFTGWNTVVLTPTEINSWLGPRAGATMWSGTGLRVEGGLLTIDLDIPDQELVRDMRAAIMTIAPAVFEARGALERGRSDGSPKCMFFLRRSGDPFIIRSHKWSYAPEDDTAPWFAVEIFASERTPEGKVQRQVGAFGPHTVDERGKVVIEYAWKGPSPVDVPLDDLPAIDIEEAQAIALEFDRLAVAVGMQPVVGYRRGKVEAKDLYDLEETMRFDGEDFHQVSLSELIEIFWQNDAVPIDTRCSGSFVGGGTRLDRCHVGWSGARASGHITIHDYATGITHRPKDAEPVTPEGISEAISEVAALFRSDPEDDDPDPEAPSFGDKWNAAIGEAVSGDLSEDACALALVGLYGERLCFDPFEKQWLRFVGPCWEAETAARIESIGAVFCRSIPLPRTPPGITLRRRLGSHRHTSAIERKLRGMLEYKGGFDRDPYLAAGQTVVVELRTGASRPGKPEDRLRKQLACDPLDESDCPLWRRFLDQVTLSDKELQRFLQQWAGLGLCGDPTHQKLAFFYGGGRNGKNTYIDTMRRIAGDYGYEADLNAFMAQRFEQHSTGTWALKGKRTVIASEVDEGATWDTIKIKALTGNDVVTARGMKRDNETFPRTWTITVIGNSQPKLKNVDEAMRRRIRMIPFDLMVADADIDPELPKRLMVEAPGILRWALNGLVDVQAHGLVEPKRVREETEEYFEAEDVIKAFVEEEVEVDPRRKQVGDPWSATSAELYRRWTAFSQERGFPAGDAKTFGKRLAKLLKVKVTHGKRSNVWHGIRLQPLRNWDEIHGLHV